MPLFDYNGKKYNVADKDIKAFAQEFPDATTMLDFNGKKYRVKSSNMEDFAKEFEMSDLLKAMDNYEWRSDLVTPDYGERVPYAPIQQSPDPVMGYGNAEVGAPITEEDTTLNPEHTGVPYKDNTKYKAATPYKDAVEPNKSTEQKFMEAIASAQATAGAKINAPKANLGLDAPATGEQMWDKALQNANFYLQSEMQIDQELAKVDAELARAQEVFYDSQEGIGSLIAQGFQAGAAQSGAFAANAGPTDPYTLSPEIRKLRARRNALVKAKEYRQISDEINKNNDFEGKSFRWSNIGVGLKKGTKDLLADKMNMGIDVSGEGLRNELSDKQSRGESLTQEEEELMSAFALEDLMRQRYGGAQSDYGFIAGQGLPVFLDFAATIAATPTSGLGKGIANQVNTHGAKVLDKLVRDFGPRSLAAYAGKVGNYTLAQTGRLAGEAANAAFTAGSFRAGEVSKNASRAMSGTALSKFDSKGNVVGGTFVDKKNANEAYYDAYTRESLEVFTEAMFMGLGLGKALGKGAQMIGSKLAPTTAASIVGFMQKVGSKGWYQAFSKIKNAANIGGIPEEMLEEYAIIPLQHMFGVAETTGTVWDELTDPETTKNILAGLSLGMGGMSVLQTGPAVLSVAAESMLERDTKKALMKRDAEGAAIFGERWDAISTRINYIDEAEIAPRMQEILDEECETTEEKMAVMQYMLATYKNRGANLMMSNKKLDSSDATAVLLLDVFEQTYNGGGSLTNIEQKMDAIRSSWPSIDREIAEYETIEDFVHANEMVPTWSELAKEYAVLLSQRNGVLARVEDQTEAKINAMSDRVRMRTHKPSGMIITTYLKDSYGKEITNVLGYPAKFYVVDGGTYNEAGLNFEGSVVVRDAEGRVQQVDASRLTGWQADISANEFIATEAERIKSEETAKVVEQIEEENLEPATPAQEAIKEEVVMGAEEALLNIPYGEGADMRDLIQSWVDNGESREYVENRLTIGYDHIPEAISLGLAYYDSLMATPQEIEEEVEALEEEAKQEEINSIAIRDKKGNLDVDAMRANGVTPEQMVEVLSEAFPEEVEGIAGDYLMLANDALAKSKDPVARRGSLRTDVEYWQAVKDLVAPAAKEEKQAQNEEKQEEEQRDADSIPEMLRAAWEKWSNAPKVYGRETTRRVKGMRLKGRFALVPAGSATGSHTADFKDNPDFIHDENGCNLNPRDYSVASNQATTLEIARNFSLQNIQVVSPEGIVYDGNGREIAGSIAARENTDRIYLEDLADRAEEFGFTVEQVEDMPHARVYFEVAPGQLDYSAQTFDLFNAPEMKASSPVELGLAMGKVLTDNTFGVLADAIKSAGGMKAVYKSAPTRRAIIKIMLDASDIKDVTTATLPQYYNEATSQLTEAGRNLLEASLLGKIFANNPDVIRMLPTIPNKVMNRVAQAMPELASNQMMGEYALAQELANALQIIYEATTSQVSIDNLAAQVDFTRGGSASEVFGKTVVMFAKALNDEIENASFADIIRSYNVIAADVVNGQGNLFGEQPTREEILQEAINHFTQGKAEASEPVVNEVEQEPAMENVEPTQSNESAEEIVTEQKPKNEGQFGLVSDARMEELKELLRGTLRNRLSVGADPSILIYGVELMAGYLDRGVKTFVDMSKVMIETFGDVIRPHLKMLYEGLRQDEDIRKHNLHEGMTPHDEVEAFDVYNFDKAKTDIFNAAKNIAENTNITSSESEENVVSSQAKEAKDKFVAEVKAEMLNALENNTRPYKSIADLRKRAVQAGLKVDIFGKHDVMLQEYVELALAQAAREIIESGKYGDRYSKENFDVITRLYDMQPTISRRSNQRINNQQYSTPLPMAFVAAMFTYREGVQSVLEPTAGNGLLVATIPAEAIYANEIDGARLENLREQGFAEVTDQDATKPFEGTFDAVIANPPFGSAQAKVIDGYEISGLDPHITLNALNNMADDGYAAIIVGGNMDYYDNGSIKGKKPFFTYLYDHYNVKGVIDMDGSLYARQGTTYPTRMILIEGRRSEEDRQKSTVYPPVQSKALPKVTSFEQLYDQVVEILNSDNKTNGHEVLQSGELPTMPMSSNSRGDSDGGRRNGELSEGNGAIEPVQRGLDGRRESILVQSGRTDNADQRGDIGERGEDAAHGRGTDRTRGLVHGESGNSQTRSWSEEGASTSERGGLGVSEREQRRLDSSDNNSGVSPVAQEKRTLESDKLPYRPHNSSMRLESVAPAAMVEAMDAVLSQIEAEYGNIDEFLQNELGYDSIETLHKALAAEQMDSVAMAIYQMKQGKALIIGDQTGVGKGRQMAALIRWAVKQGKRPIFLTQKANLFSDIYRDLVDIGSGDLNPFIFNARNGKDPGVMTAADNVTMVYSALPDAKQNEVFESGVLPEEYDYAVLTYSQVNKGDEISRKEADEAAKSSGKRGAKKPKSSAPSKKATFLRAIAKDNYLFLDESHTAAGEGNTGAYMQSILKDAKGVTFASATFAKRPDTMPLYALKTAMNDAKIEADKLIDVIRKGGVALQEVMSRALTEAGQMVRRERDMSDVRTDWKTVSDEATATRARKEYDNAISAFNAIIDFQETYIAAYIKSIAQDIADIGSTAAATRGTKKMGIDNPPFVSKAYNYTKQMMLALKVDAIVDEVVAEIEAGRHPVIALESTMESALDGYKVGDVVTNPTFSSSLLKGLDSVMQITIRNSKGQDRTRSIRPEDLGPEGERAYWELVSFINESAKGVFISPLDAIIDKLTAKGYRVGEMTGRSVTLKMNTDGKYEVTRRTNTNKKQLAGRYNSGELDVLILNKSASTGISLHASKKFSDQRQRSMIIVQPLSDINDYMQMIGRIDRTGQVHRGYYINLGLPVPAENRFLMMLSTKLKSLNANTTTSQENEGSNVEAPDLLNKYGDQVVVEYLRDNPDIYEKMGEPLGVESNSLDEYLPSGDEARKITGRAALLSTEEQDAFYDDVVKRYADLIAYLDETNSNDLKITVLPLKAKTLSKVRSSEGIDPTGANPFAKDAYVEKVEMDVLKKPMSAKDIRKTIENLAQGMEPSERVQAVMGIVRQEFDAKMEAESERYNKAVQAADELIAKYTEKVENDPKIPAEDKDTVVDSYARSQLERVDQKHDENVRKLRVQGQIITERLRLFEVGQTYMLADDLQSMVYTSLSPAIFCGFKAKDSKVTPSTTIAVFATLDGRRRVEVKLSNGVALNSIHTATRENLGSAMRTDLDNWDSQVPNSARKQGYIMTGNLLQAVADSQREDGSFPGQLVSYTDNKGNILDGILMPDNWSISQLRAGGVPINARVEQIRSGEPMQSVDGKVSISLPGRNYILEVPKTKEHGEKYWGAKSPLLPFVENGYFYVRGGKMRGAIWPENLDNALNVLAKLGVQVPTELESVDTDNEEDATEEEGTLYRTSEEIEAEYPNWLEGTTTDSGKHSTQVEGTRKTYNKVGTWIEENLGKDVAILDASSGMGYGTADLRERGFNIEDVEPYQSEERKQNNPATYDSYDAIDKEYDFIISNAVLNVIPDDWRANVLHSMASKLRKGGKMFINTRKAGEEKNIKDKIELDSPQEVLVKRNGKIASYQRFFTPSELKSWVESELGEGYSVEVANKKNSNTSGLAAVVVSKNNESPAKGKTSELGRPISSKENAPLANVGAKVDKNVERAKRLDNIFSFIEKNTELGPHEFLHEVMNAVTLDNTSSSSRSKYVRLGGGVTLRMSDHYANLDTFARRNDISNNYGLVIKLSSNKFKSEEGIDYLEYVYFPDKLNKSRQLEIIRGLKNFLSTGRYELLPKADKVNTSGKFSKDYFRKGEGALTNEELSLANDPAAKLYGQSFRTKAQQKKFADNVRQQMAKKAQTLSEKLGLPVEVLESNEGLTGKKAKAKGWYDVKSGKITIVLSNNESVADVEETILHEGVAHLGLRKLFGKQFTQFLDNVYNNAEQSIRDQIDSFAKKNNVSIRTATEEYLAHLAESTDFERAQQSGWWQKIKSFFLKMLDSIGFEYKGKEIGDVELRYLLWRSYENLTDPSRRFNPFSQAREVAMEKQMQKEAKERKERERILALGTVDNNRFSGVAKEAQPIAEEREPSELFREGGSPFAPTLREEYDKLMASARGLIKETYVDHLSAIEKLQKLITRETGKAVTDLQDVYSRMLDLPNVNAQQFKSYEYQVMPILTKAIQDLIGGFKSWNEKKAVDLQKYVKVKHGIERNRDMAVRAAMQRKANVEFGAMINERVAELEGELIPRVEEQIAILESQLKDPAFKLVKEQIKEELKAPKAELRALKKERSEISKFPAKYGFQTYEEILSEIQNEWYGLMERVRSEDKTWREQQERMDVLAKERFGESILNTEYSGLAETLGMHGEEVADVRVAAYAHVEEYEMPFTPDEVSNLWTAISFMNNWSLEKQKATGLADQKYLDDCHRRYQFYVPLRGFEEGQASDMYDYLDNEHHEASNPVIAAKGRTSEAFNPFESIVKVGLQSISTGNRNLALQSYWDLATRTDVRGFLSPNRAWYVTAQNDEEYAELDAALKGVAVVNGDQILPRIAEDATRDEVLKIVEAYEAEMKELAKVGLVSQKYRSSRPVAKHASVKEINAHTNVVYINGEKRTVTIIGSPRVAQALRGELDPVSLVWDWYKGVQRFMSSAMTAKNTSFAASNVVRDTGHGAMRAFIKENPEYAARYIGKAAWRLINPLRWGDTLRMLNRYEMEQGVSTRFEKIKAFGSKLTNDERYARFKRFMDQGGATGYTFSLNQDERLNLLAEMAENKEGKKKISAMNPVGIFDMITSLSESAELVNRFIAYEVALETGKSELQAIRDARNITLDFTRRGAGVKTYNAKRGQYEKSRLKRAKYHVVNALAWLSQYCRDNIIFWNASVQGNYQTYEMFKTNPIKSILAMLATPVAAAYMMPLINGLLASLWGDDDDDNKDEYGGYYDNLAPWDRQNNVCILLPNGWLKIPIPVGVNKVYAIGDALAAKTYGKGEFDFLEDGMANVLGMFSPVDINWGDKDQDIFERAANVTASFMPSAIQTELRIAANKDWKGNPVQKETPYNEKLPEYLQTYKGTNKTLVNLSKWLHKTGNADGVETYERHESWREFNPAIVEEWMSGHFGGWSTTTLGLVDGISSIAQIVKKGDATWDDISKVLNEGASSRKAPVVSRFYTSGSKGQVAKALVSTYHDEVDSFMKSMQQRERQLKNDAESVNKGKDDFEYAQVEASIKFFQQSNDYKKYVNLKEAYNFMKKVLHEYEAEDIPVLYLEGMKEMLQVVREEDPFED